MTVTTSVVCGRSHPYIMSLKPCWRRTVFPGDAPLHDWMPSVATAEPLAHIRGLATLPRELEVAMHEGDRDTALTHGCSHALHRSRANITDREDPGGARFESERLAVGLPLSRLHRVGPRQHESVLVARDLRREPIGRRFGADEDEEHPGLPSRCRAGSPVDDFDRLELLISVHPDNLGSGFHADVP